MIFVLGPGRSGTSTVARLLHEMGVSMGEKFRPPDETNPKGYWEDLEFKDLNAALLEGRLTLAEWRERLPVRSEPWGLKDPRLCYLLPYYLREWPEAQLVRVRRPLDEIAESMSRCYGWPLGDALAEANRREALLDRFAPNSTDIELRSEKEMKCQLSSLLK